MLFVSSVFIYKHNLFLLLTATIDVKRNIYDLSVNMFGSQIAIVENQGGFDSVQESIVRIYAVGRKRNTEDDAEDDEEDELDGSDGELSSAGDTIGWFMIFYLLIQ